MTTETIAVRRPAPRTPRRGLAVRFQERRALRALQSELRGMDHREVGDLAVLGRR